MDWDLGTRLRSQPCGGRNGFDPAMEQNQNRPRGLSQVDRGGTRSFVRCFKAKERGAHVKNGSNVIQAAPRATANVTPAAVSCTPPAPHPCSTAPALQTQPRFTGSLPWDVPIFQMEEMGNPPIYWLAIE